MIPLAKVVTWTYEARRSRKFRHGVFADFGDNKRDQGRITEAARAITQNPVLEGLSEKIDYEWFGPLGVAFHKKDRAALFLLFAADV